MDLSSSLSLWAHGSVWLFFACLMFLKFSNSDMVLTPALPVYLVLLVLLHWFCHVCLPMALGVLFLSSACWYVLGIVSPKKMLPVAGKAVFITGLWALVNNAGFCAHFGDAELSLMSTYRGCMEVNFFGTLGITKALLPLLRCSKGRLVAVSSPAGEHSFPFLAAYGSSKAALSRVMDTFRHELKPWGVKVSVIQPASYKTGAHDNVAYWEQQHQNQLASLPTDLLQDYGEEYISETKSLFMKYADTARSDFSPVIDSITDAVISENPKVKYFAGNELWLLYFIGNYMPHSISDNFFKGLFLKNRIVPRALRKQQSLSEQY
ncbi:11-beta-hydroxysteroid dehydrogenase type 2-like [Ascaphus truei]|uniref:11-beta-hydroxysteroid dehydrogenase type 2-like n=1 Tax=Ascaphus truei TaxID=8439 RepID=UPI003F59E3AA